MRLREIAHARTGDKGRDANISVIAYDPADWPLIRRMVTAERVRACFPALPVETVERYELPKIAALNFVLRGALYGGVTRSLALDPHGKCLGQQVLKLWIVE